MVDDPHCLNCKNRWSNEILESVTKKTFLNGEFYKHRKAVLLNREKSYLTEYQEEAANKKKLERLAKERDELTYDYTVEKDKFDIKMMHENIKRTELQKEEYIQAGKITAAKKRMNILKKNDAPEAEIVAARGEIIEHGRVFDEIKDKIKKMGRRVKIGSGHYYYQDYDPALSKMSRQLTEIYNKINACYAAQNRLKDNTVEKKKFVRKCTVTGCNGFLSTAWKCEMCENWSCSKCFEVKGLDNNAEHVCTPDNLATAELIRRDTKPCPKCGEMISKIDGCDQMWCITCHTPFSWTTGREVTGGVIHNPHYYQWLRNNGNAVPRNPLDNPCGGAIRLIDSRRLVTVLNNYRASINGADVPVVNKVIKDISDIHRKAAEISDMARYRFRAGNIRDEFKELAISFLLNDINEEEWESALVRIEKNHLKMREFTDIYDAFKAASIDILNALDVTPIPTNVVDTLNNVVLQMNNLKGMTNRSLKDVLTRYKSSIKDIFIEDDWKTLR